MPDDFGVASLVFDYRVAFELRPCPASIVAVDDTFAAASAGVESDEDVFFAVFETTGVVFIDESAS